MTGSNKLGLFDLPREIRDQIYKLVLEHDTPLQYVPRSTHEKRQKSGFYTSKNDLYEYNQIKYVNRQLWTETAGLEVEHNTLLFCPQPTGASSEQLSDLQRDAVASEETSQMSGLRLLLNFLRSSTPGRILKLRIIHVRSAEPELNKKMEPHGQLDEVKEEDFSAILQFCLKYPKMTVVMIIADFTGIHVLLMNIYQLFGLNMRDVPADIMFLAEYMERMHIDLNPYKDFHKGYHKMDDPIPANSKFKLDGEFNEPALRENINATGTDNDDMYPDLRPQKEELLLLLRQCYEDGF